MRRHEGPEALISERTPRQTEGEERAKGSQKTRRKQEEGERRRKSGLQGVSRSFRRNSADGEKSICTRLFTCDGMHSFL